MGLDATIYRDEEEEHEIASVRLGNTAMINHLRRVLEAGPANATILLTKVLYSGTHSGDRLTTAEARRAEREMDDVRANLSGDPEVEAFAVSFGRLLDVALEHDRPVMF